MVQVPISITEVLLDSVDTEKEHSQNNEKNLKWKVNWQGRMNT